KVKAGLAQMLKGGVIMDVVTPGHARIAQDAGACAVMALERVPADIRKEGGVARMSDPQLIKSIMAAVTIPVMAKCRIGHFVEAQILEALGIDYIDESEVLTPADEENHIDKHPFKVPFVCGCRDLGEAARRISEGAAMIRTKGEAGTGNVVEAVRHMRQLWDDIRRIQNMPEDELPSIAKELGAPVDLVKEVHDLGKLPVVNFAAGGIATPADAALSLDALNDELDKLGIKGWSLHSEPVMRGAINATRAHVDLAESPQPHRRLPDILSLLEASSLDRGDVERSQSVFTRLAQAEARVHGVAPEDIEFHEVGALDAIVDVVGGVVGLRLLGVENLYCSARPAGGGTVRAAHGVLPAPAPGTLELMAMASAPLASSSADRPMEMVTPTGAALVTTLARFERPAMYMSKVGHGAGGRDPEGWPNVLRLWVGERIEPVTQMLQIETNIDDM